MQTESHGNRVAIITGAGSGIGRALAQLLVEHDYHLALVGRTPATLQETADMCTQINPGCECMVIPADLRDGDSAQHIIEKVIGRWQRIDALFNVAGNAPLMTIDKITPESWRDCVDGNLSGPVLLTAAVWPVFTKQKSGFVGNVSSMASIDPFPGFAIYAAAKTGLNMFTHCTAREGRPIKVKAVAVAPGAVETAMLRANFGLDLIAKDKTLKPEEVAAVLCDCLTGQRQFKSGETIALPSPA